MNGDETHIVLVTVMGVTIPIAADDIDSWGSGSNASFVMATLPKGPAI